MPNPSPTQLLRHHTHDFRRCKKRLHKPFRITKTLRKPHPTQRIRRRHSPTSLLLISNQPAKLTAAAISSVEERVRHALGGVDIRATTAVRFRFPGVLEDWELDVARTAEEEVLYEAFAGEAEGEFVGDDVDDWAVGADFDGCGGGGGCGGDEGC